METLSFCLALFVGVSSLSLKKEKKMIVSPGHAVRDPSRPEGLNVEFFFFGHFGGGEEKSWGL